MSNTFNPIRPVLIVLNNIALYVILHPQRSVFEFSLSPLIIESSLMLIDTENTTNVGAHPRPMDKDTLMPFLCWH